jgi:hypothetical protein
MKTLLNKKFITSFVALLFIILVNAQIPDQLKNLPSFKLRASILSSLKKTNLPGRINAFGSSNNAPCLNKQTTLGGTGDDIEQRILPIGDGSFIVIGGTNSTDGNFRVPAANGGDAFIAKYNHLKQLEWTKTFGGTGDDFFNDINQTCDGGYIAVGYTSSNDGDVSGNHGNYDVWVVKLSESGNIQWQKCLGGSAFEFGDAGIQTFYGGYTIVSSTFSDDGDVSGNHGQFDAWVVQLSPAGKQLYQRCYGGSGNEFVNFMVSSDWGSFIFEGPTTSNDGDVSGNHGGTDAWIVKINALGKIIWQKTVGDTTEDNPSPNIAKTTDGNIVIDGYSYVASGEVGPKDSLFSFITKLNSFTGNIIWYKNYHNPAERGGFGIFATADGGTVETGHITNSIFDGSTWDVLVSKFDAYGKQQWYKTLGGSDFDGGFNGGFEDKNGNLNILCQTASTDGDVKNNHGGVDIWLIKLGRCGEKNVDDATSTDDVIAVSKNNAIIELYPNPAKDVLKVEGLNTLSKTTLSLFNISGKLIQQATANSANYSFNIQKLSAGNYYITIQSGEKTATLKFVKE